MYVKLYLEVIKSMANLYKSRKQYTMTVDIKLFDTLNALSEKTRIPKSKLVDEALELLFEKHNIEIIDQDENN